jgi:hypothetical protein
MNQRAAASFNRLIERQSATLQTTFGSANPMHEGFPRSLSADGLRGHAFTEA